MSGGSRKKQIPNLTIKDIENKPMKKHIINSTVEASAPPCTRFKRRLALMAAAALAAAMFFGSTSQAAFLTWDPLLTTTGSDGDGTWNTGTTADWASGGADIVWAASSGAIVGNGTGAAGTITVSGTVAATSLTINPAGSGNYIFSGGTINLGSTGILTNKSSATINSALPFGTMTFATSGQTLTLGGGSAGFNAVTIQGQPAANGLTSTVQLSAGAYTAVGSGPIVSIGDVNALTGGLIIGSGSSVSSVSSFTAGRNVTGLMVVNGGTFTESGGGDLIIGRSVTGKVVLQSGAISNNVTTAGNGVLIGFQGGGVGELDINGGTFMTTTTFVGINNGSATSGKLVISGGVTTTPVIDFGGGFSASSSGTGSLVVNGGSVYLGSGGLVKVGTGTFSQTTTLSGGTVGATANWSSSLPMTLTNLNGNITFQSADSGSNPFNITLSGALTGVGGLNKTGGGILTLSGVNTYSSATVISNGTLAIATAPIASTNGDVTLDGSAGSPVLSMQVANAGQFWSITNLTFANGTPALDCNYAAIQPSSAQAPIQANGNLAFTATPTVTIEGSAITVGTFPLIKYIGALSGTPPSTVAITVTGGGSASGYVTNITVSKTIALVVTSSTVTPGLSWRVGNGVWDINTTANWSQFGGAAKYTDGSAVLFDDSASGSSPITVTLNTTVNPGSIGANESAKNYVISGTGAIAGSTSLSQNGAGTLTLSGTNTYSGGTTLAGGQLNINYGGDGSLNSAIGTGPLTITGGSLGNTTGTNLTLLTPIAQNWNGNFGYSGSANNLNLGTGAVTLGGNFAVNVASNILEVDGVISDNGNNYSLTKTGSGALTLTNNNTYTGGTLVSAGQLNINGGGDGGADSPVGTGRLTISGGAIDNTSGSDVVLQTAIPESWVNGGDQLTFIGTGNLDLGSGQVNLLVSAPSFTLTVSSNTLTTSGPVISNGHIMDKVGNGTWVISGNNGNNGGFPLTVDAGVVKLNKALPYNCVGPSAGALTVNANGTVICTDPNNFLELAANVPLVLAGGKFDLNASSQQIISVALNSGSLANGDTNNSVSTLTVLATNGVVLGSANCVFNIASGSGLAISDPNSPGSLSGSGSLILTNGGVLTVNGINTYTGNTTIYGGALALLSNGSISNQAAILLARTNSILDLSGNAGGLTLNSGQTMMGNGSIFGDLVAPSGSIVVPGASASIGTLTVTNNITLAGKLLLNLNRTNALTSSKLVSLNGSITYGGTLSVTNIGPALQAGDSFQLFPGAVSGFTGGINLATTDATGNVYTWTNKVAIDGSIRVLTASSSINPLPGTIQVSVSGNTLSLSWPTNAGWLLQTQTNSLAVGLGTNWVTVSGSDLVTSTNITINPANGAAFYRMLHP